MLYSASVGEAKRLASRLRFLLRVLLKRTGTLTFNVSHGSHRRAVHKHATLPLCPWLAVIALGLAFLGLAARALIPDLVYDDLAYLVSADPGNATADNGDGDDDGKLVPHDGSTMCKCGDFAKAIFVTVAVAVPLSLVPVYGLAAPDEAGEIALPDRYLPNGETGPPIAGRHRAQATTTATRSLFSHPQQASPVALTDQANPR